ncbi:MAG: DUF1801 domain-containing protein [Actinomycetes bacterium]
MKRAPAAVAQYFAGQPSPHKQTLLEMRKRILEVVPDAQEIIKYNMPTFVVDGVEVAGILGHKNHIGYYPYSGSVLNQFPELEGKYRMSKGALQMPIDKPLPKTLIRKLIRARLALG